MNKRHEHDGSGEEPPKPSDLRSEALKTVDQAVLVVEETTTA